MMSRDSRIRRSSWATVTTLRENRDVTLDFVAHHKSLGADEIHLFFDDPKDPVAAEVEGLAGVVVTRCDGAHWKSIPGRRRPSALDARQRANAAVAYAKSQADWIIHLDADEHVHADTDPGHILAQCGDLDAVRLEPAEIMIAPRQRPLTVFRRALPATEQGDRIGAQVYGDAYPHLDGGLLARRDGKVFVRGGREDVKLDIHAPLIGGTAQPGAAVRGLRLLHFHGEDQDAWVAKVQDRLKAADAAARKAKGRKRKTKPEEPARTGCLDHLRQVFASGGEDGLRDFHQAVCTFDQDARLLKRADALMKLQLWRSEKRETWFPSGQTQTARRVGMHPDTGQLEAEVTFRGLTLATALNETYVETQIATGNDPEAQEMDQFTDLVRGQRVRFWEIGGTAGLYAMLCARHAHADSRITVLEPNPNTLNRLRRNLAANGLTHAKAFCLALGPGLGTVRLDLPAGPGAVSVADDDETPGTEVPMRPLSHFVPSLRDEAPWIMKIDVAGAEAEVLTPFFRDAAPELWPDYILYDHANAGDWTKPPKQVFPPEAYGVEAEYRQNTLLKRNAESASRPAGQDAFARALMRAAR